LKNILLSFIVFSFVGCSLFDKKSDDNPTPNTFADISLTTITPTIANNSIYIATGGISNLNLTSVASVEYGVCFSDLPNPTVLNDKVSANNQGEKEFGVTINNIKLGSTYYFKAFVRNYQTGEVKYGNELNLAIPLSLNTTSVTNISVTGFKVNVNVGENLAGNSRRGICFSTSQNPTVQNTNIASDTQGSGLFSIDVTSLYTTKSTTYYIKSFVLINNVYYYGNQLTAKTGGYISGSGGYVFYDKGEFTNGWRYLEAAPTALTYLNNSYFKWGCSSSFLTNISTDIGTGLENTNVIKGVCAFNNIGAYACFNYSLNNNTDWFLPSLDEAKELFKLKSENVVTTGIDYIWTSSQLSNTLAYSVSFGNGAQVTELKTNLNFAWQVRRF
jgi:hypothetical protein